MTVRIGGCFGLSQEAHTQGHVLVGVVNKSLSSLLNDALLCGDCEGRAECETTLRWIERSLELASQGDVFSERWEPRSTTKWNATCPGGFGACFHVIRHSLYVASCELPGIALSS